MSRITNQIELKLTKEQKSLVKSNLSKDADTIIIDPNSAKNLIYAVATGAISEKDPSKLVLTKEQQAILKEKLKSNCEYIEITSDMKFR